MEIIFKIVINILIFFNINSYQINDYAHGVSNYNNYEVTTDHQDVSILRKALHEINKTINSLMSTENVQKKGPGGYVYVNKSGGHGLSASKIIFVFMIFLSLFLFVYKMLTGGKDGGQLLSLFPMFGMTLFIWYILYGYTGIAGYSSKSELRQSTQCGGQGNVIESLEYHQGFIRLSHDILKWTTGALHYTDSVTINVSHYDKKNGAVTCQITTRGAEIIDDPWKLMDIEASISAQLAGIGESVKTAWKIKSKLEGNTSVLNLGLWSKWIGLNILLFIAQCFTFICFAAIALVLFLNLVFLKLIGIVAMFIIPLILVEPLKSYAQQGLGSLMSFAVKFLTYVILISMLLSFINEYKVYTENSINREIQRMTTTPQGKLSSGLIIERRGECYNKWLEREIINQNAIANEIVGGQPRGNPILIGDTTQAFQIIKSYWGKDIASGRELSYALEPFRSVIGRRTGRGSTGATEAEFTNDSTYVDCHNQAKLAEQSIGFYFFFELLLIITVYTYMLLIIPGKVAQVFGGNIAFGDGQVTGLASKFLSSTPMMGLAAAQTLNAGLISPAASQIGGALAARTLGKLNDKEVKEGGLSGEDLLRKKQAEIRRGSQKGFFEEAREGLKDLNSRTGTAIAGLSMAGLAATSHAKQLNLGKVLESDAKVAGPGSDAAKAHAAFVDKHEKPAKVFGSANLTEEEKAAAQLSPQQAAKIEADRAASKSNLRRYQAGAFESKGSKQGGGPQKSTLFDKIEPSPQQVAASKAAAASTPQPAPTSDDISRAIADDGELVKVSDMTPEQKEAYDKENAVRGALDK